MVALPADWTTGTTPTNLTARQKLELIRGFVAQTPGGAAQESLTLSSGAVTPSVALFQVDTEGAAAADDLDTVTFTNLPTGSIFILRSTDATRVVSVTQAGNLLLRDGKSVVLRNPSHFIAFARIGASGVELFRSVGNSLRTVRALTAATTLVASDSGTTITNTAAAGDLDHPLPAATVGMAVRVRVTVAFKIKLTANGTDTIRDGTSISAAGGNTEIAAVIGNGFDLECFEAGKWVVSAFRGTLTTT